MYPDEPQSIDDTVTPGSGGLMAKMFASQSKDCGFKPNSGHDYVSSFDTSNDYFQEADFKVIILS
jgi:hypothetical protein